VAAIFVDSNATIEVLLRVKMRVSRSMERAISTSQNLVCILLLVVGLNALRFGDGGKA
jgi:hypothetical protein